ncbi:hypothetical protein ACIU1J_32280 [Azospirillum doebereinerae]|uniref:hypothetical protein n=1 Tax=Azospirillum doebereinerae TaxID=92933 RepID=UPI001EE4EEC5|nr:hypothetical protein [Azospirillum doebereinerae]MCG5238380.1 hypothetical protein [Azospirillum doebereinerae]
MTDPVTLFQAWFKAARIDRPDAVELLGVAKATVDKALAAKNPRCSEATAARIPQAARQQRADLEPFAAPLPGETVLVPIRIPDRGAVLQVQPVGVSRLLGAGLLYCDDAGRLCVAESHVAEALVELHGGAEEGLADTVVDGEG